MKRQVYLDHAASTPLDPGVFEAMRPWLLEKFHNPSSLYGAARQAQSALEEARHQVAQAIGAKKSEIIFTAGGTESVNLAILGTARALLPSNQANNSPSPNIVSSIIEHESVLACLKQLEQEGFSNKLVAVDSNGITSLTTLSSAIDDDTILVSIAYANSEIGTIQPIAKISQIIANVRADRQKRGVRTPIYLHTDAAQAAGSLDLRVARLGIDLMSLNGSKIYGPKQSGCLYVRTGTKLQPLIFGGGQEARLRSGSQSVAAAVGFATALEMVQSNRQSEILRQSELRDNFINQIKDIIPEAIINGDMTKRLPGNINISIPGIDGESAVLYLDNNGIMAATGSACSTGNKDPSHVLIALGLSNQLANNSLRFTLGKTTSSGDLNYLVSVLPKVIKQLRRLNS